MDGKVQVEKEVYVNLKTHRRGRGWRLAVVLSVQNALVAVCLALTFYCFWDQQRSQGIEKQEDRTEIFIHFDAVTDIADEVRFMGYESSLINLSSSSEIRILCNGTYMLYMEVYSEGLDEKPGQGTLQLMVGGRGLANITVEAQDKGCKDSVHHQVVYLRNGDNCTLRFSPTNLKVCKLTLGLHYLLGSRCLK